MSQAKVNTAADCKVDRPLSLFATERTEDYAAIVVAFIILLVIIALPLSSVKIGKIEVDPVKVQAIQAQLESGSKVPNADPVQLVLAEGKQYNLKFGAKDVELSIPSGQDKSNYKPSGAAVVIVKHKYASQVAEFGVLLEQPDKKGDGGAWVITQIGGKKGILNAYKEMTK